MFCDLLGLSASSFLDSYISQRESGKSNRDIIESEGFLGTGDLEDFFRRWMKAIELPEYLASDKVLQGVLAWLEAHGDNFDIYVCTNRQEKSSTVGQIEELGLSQFFVNVLVTEQRFTKAQLISSSSPNVSTIDWIIGDSPEDVREGKKLGVRTCAVLTGFPNEALLSIESPSLILDSLRDFPGIPDALS